MVVNRFNKEDNSMNKDNKYIKLAGKFLIIILFLLYVIFNIKSIV